MNRLNSSKRGNAILDSITVVLFIFIFALVSFLIYPFLTEINDDVQADSDSSQRLKDTSADITTNYPAVIDNGVAMIFLLLWVGGIIASYMIDSHPIFFVLIALLIVILSIAGMFLSNVYSDITTDDNYNEYRSDFPISSWIFDNLLIIILAMGFTIGLALYGKMAT